MKIYSDGELLLPLKCWGYGETGFILEMSLISLLIKQCGLLCVFRRRYCSSRSSCRRYCSQNFKKINHTSIMGTILIFLECYNFNDSDHVSFILLLSILRELTSLSVQAQLKNTKKVNKFTKNKNHKK